MKGTIRGSQRKYWLLTVTTFSAFPIFRTRKDEKNVEHSIDGFGRLNAAVGGLVVCGGE